MFILFDIDLTLITTQGAGLRAMTAAARQVFTPSFEINGIEIAGRLDPLIMHDMLRHNGFPADAESLRSFRDAYVRMLPASLRQSTDARALPGAIDLIHAMRSRAADGHITLGILTGNFAESGAMKLRHCGIDPEWFDIRVWGDESPHEPPRREHLVPVAMERFRRARGYVPNPSRVILIGDTPHDVAAARANRCRCVGVATGRSSVDELRDARADLVLPDLTHTRPLHDFLAIVERDPNRV